MTCSAEDFPANLFLLQDIGEVSLTQEARFSLSLPGWLKRESLHICCLRTYPACFTKLIQYLTDSGITIPESVNTDTIRGIIIELEDNPEHSAPIVGDILIADLYEDIRNLVVEYEASKK